MAHAEIEYFQEELERKLVNWDIAYVTNSKQSLEDAVPVGKTCFDLVRLIPQPGSDVRDDRPIVRFRRRFQKGCRYQLRDMVERLDKNRRFDKDCYFNNT